MMLFYFHSGHSCTKDPLPSPLVPADDNIPRTDMKHVTVAMLSVQLKSLGEPSYVA